MGDAIIIPGRFLTPQEHKELRKIGVNTAYVTKFYESKTREQEPRRVENNRKYEQKN